MFRGLYLCSTVALRSPNLLHHVIILLLSSCSVITHNHHTSNNPSFIFQPLNQHRYEIERMEREAWREWAVQAAEKERARRMREEDELQAQEKREREARVQWAISAVETERQERVMKNYLSSLSNTNWFNELISTFDSLADYELCCPYYCFGCRTTCRRSNIAEHLNNCEYNSRRPVSSSSSPRHASSANRKDKAGSNGSSGSSDDLSVIVDGNDNDNDYNANADDESPRTPTHDTHTHNPPLEGHTPRMRRKLLQFQSQPIFEHSNPFAQGGGTCLIFIIYL